MLNFETRTTKSNCENAGGTWETSGVQNTYIVCEPHTIETVCDGKSHKPTGCWYSSDDTFNVCWQT